MTLHAVCQYFFFRMHAKGRHGTHSPFVYQFVEQVLRHKNNDKVTTNTENLLAHLSAVYGLNVSETTLIPDSIVLLPVSEPQNWVKLIADYSSVLTQGFLVLPAIHSTAKHTKNWEIAKSQAAVSMSIDLYHSGLLLSRPEFKEKQNFVLR